MVQYEQAFQLRVGDSYVGSYESYGAAEVAAEESVERITQLSDIDFWYYDMSDIESRLVRILMSLYVVIWYGDVPEDYLS